MLEQRSSDHLLGASPLLLSHVASAVAKPVFMHRLLRKTHNTALEISSDHVR